MYIFSTATHKSAFLAPRSVYSAAVFFFVVASLLMLTGCGADDPAGSSNEGFNLGEEDYNNENNNENNDENGTQEYTPPSEIRGINTVVNPLTITAGETLDVDCIYLDPAGQSIDVSEEQTDGERILFYPDNAFEKSGDDIVAITAGDAEVACQAPQFGLTDEEPAQVVIEPASVHSTTTSLNDHQITAGEYIEAACEAYDAYGNQIDTTDFELVVDTSSSGIVIDSLELSASITTSGLFVFNCHVAGATIRHGAAVEVVPDKPAALFADPIPDQELYGIGQVITVGTVVQDRFDNRIHDAAIDYNADPAGESFGAGRFRFFQDGIYTLSAQVTEETHDDVDLYEEFDIVINDTGPSINCLDPFDGEMINHGGSSMTFNGTVGDTHGVAEVYVNDEPVSVDKGAFSTTVDTDYGINFVDIAAVDIYGEENVRTCAFMTSSNWEDEDGFIDNAVSLSLFQDAIDDKNYQGRNNIRSLNDLIMTVVRSPGLRNEIRSQLLSESFEESAVGCTFEISVTDLRFPNIGHETSLDLMGGGISLESEFTTIQIDLNIDSGFFCPGGSPTMTVDWMDIDLTSNLGLSGTTPSFTLNDVDRVESGDVSLSGAWGILSFFFQGTFQDLVEDLFEDAITDNFDDLFGGLMDSLDVDSLSTSFDVPRLDGSGSLPLDFAFQFSHVNATSTRALFGLAPKITSGGGSAHGITSLGVPRPAGNMLMDSSGNSAAAAAHVALINQALHALWRGGLFHADVGGALGDDIPDGAAVELETHLPPMLVLDSNSGAELMLGAVEINLQYPGIFDEPVTMMVGATASTQIHLQGEEISFDDVQIEEFHLSAMDVSLNSGSRDVLENFLAGLFQDIFDQSLNAALPALPIPSFEIPASMGSYNLNAGDEVGLFNTTMNQSIRHLELHGHFGIE